MTVVKSHYPRWALATLLVLLVGCGKQAPVENSASTPAPAENPPELMEVVDFAGWDSVTESHNSEVLLVDLWATWCISCIERFPEMVTMHQRFKDQNVTFASLNLDQTNDVDALLDANEFLAESGAQFDHYHLREDMMTTFERFNLLGIPAVIFYDKAGNELMRLTGDDPNNQFDKASIEAALNTLLSATRQ